LKKALSFLLLFASILCSLVGLAGFILLFVPHFDITWFILAPFIFALYQSPAVFLFWLWKKQRKKD